MLILIGYWLGPSQPGWPDVRDLVDESWDPHERDAVIAHLRGGRSIHAYLGLSPCRVCSRANGSAEQTDGTYCWPEGLAHYLEKHQVRLPSRFVEHVLRGPAVAPKVATADLKRAKLYPTWWRGQTWRTGPTRYGTDHYVGELLEMLRQDVALSRWLGYDAPSWPELERLGRAGTALLQAVEEAQRQHESRYGPPDPGLRGTEQLAAHRSNSKKALARRSSSSR